MDGAHGQSWVQRPAEVDASLINLQSHSSYCAGYISMDRLVGLTHFSASLVRPDL